MFLIPTRILGYQISYKFYKVVTRESHLNVLWLWVVCLISMCLRLRLLCFQLRFLYHGAPVVAGCRAVCEGYTAMP
jgi:hypothetical protein